MLTLALEMPQNGIHIRANTEHGRPGFIPGNNFGIFLKT